MRISPVSTHWSIAMHVGIALLVTVAFCAVLGWALGVGPRREVGE